MKLKKTGIPHFLDVYNDDGNQLGSVIRLFNKKWGVYDVNNVRINENEYATENDAMKWFEGQ